MVSDDHKYFNAAQLSQFDKYFLGSRITDLSKCILFDRHDMIRRHFQYILSLPFNDRGDLIRDLIASIQFYLESISSARQRYDAYKLYFLSNIALNELVRHAYILDGKIEYNYNPPQFVVDPNLMSTMDLVGRKKAERKNIEEKMSKKK